MQVRIDDGGSKQAPIPNGVSTALSLLSLILFVFTDNVLAVYLKLQHHFSYHKATAEGEQSVLDALSADSVSRLSSLASFSSRLNQV
ncbi:hypothetical protein FB45DRAFT_208306 [Roridomyces roridus]|uniref:Uncharacterized protein n=1 Tax=Roridomyces roridus TaxID=1738132 RepID=A0AAD7FX91_9AGAR|nr:hypothetical protein FB45DRAFT_208306 [Roridomyces roridus]